MRKAIMLNRARFSPMLFIAMASMVVFTIIAWLFRVPLHAYSLEHPAFFTASVLATSVFCILLGLVQMVESIGLKRTWLARTASITGVEQLSPPGVLASLPGNFPDPLEALSKPIFRTRLGRRLRLEWIEADLGNKASRYLLLLLFFAGIGFFLGIRIGGVLLATALALSGPLLPRAIVRNRAERYQSRFSTQLPQVLDGLASGLSAGLSFQGAVDYVLSELTEPSRSAFTRMSNRLALGIPVEDALLRLGSEAQEEGLNLVIDGLILQRQFGGDLVQMLGETAALLRERMELEREVRAITTQGRLSGIIIAALVPISAGFLLAFNPRYIDVLFDNLIGQMLVILALVLQLIGWAIISRLVRIHY